MHVIHETGGAVWRIEYTRREDGRWFTRKRNAKTGARKPWVACREGWEPPHLDKMLRRAAEVRLPQEN